MLFCRLQDNNLKAIIGASIFFQNKTEKITIMATVNVLNQMAEYDFNAPIDVEMIFEDSDNDDPSIQSALSEQQNINDNNKQVPVEQCVTKPKTDNKQYENQINIESLNKSMLSLNQNSRVLQCKHSIGKNNENEKNNLNNMKNSDIRMNPNEMEHCHNQNESDANRTHASIIIDNDTVNNEGRLPSTSGSNNNHEPVTTFIEDLLNKLSEHIVLIMQSFYHYGIKRNNEDNKKREDVFHFIKSHFFELSYSTVESVFLPQEQNESFINQFLDNTVLIANNKALRWRCHRGHVLPFFKELITWTKQKKQHTKNNHPPCPSNGNILLKEQLVRPLLPLNLPQSEIIANSNIATQNIQNNLCIFSSGPPGSEISINIDANTLMQINKRQQSTVRAEQNRSYNNNAQTCDSTRRQKSVASPTNRNRVKDIQKINPQYDRPPPPPYHISHSANRIPYRPQQYNQTNVNTIRNHYDNIGPPQQNHQNIGPGTPQQYHQNIGQPINNYPTQVHYINTNHTSPPHNGSLNYLYNNPNRNISMYPTRMENQVTSSPVISNVSSLDLNGQMYNARCYMCGQRTSAPCYPYNSLRRQYCSYLCQISEMAKPKKQTKEELLRKKRLSARRHYERIKNNEELWKEKQEQNRQNYIRRKIKSYEYQ